jgi:hypothetical protein
MLGVLWVAGEPLTAGAPHWRPFARLGSGSGVCRAVRVSAPAVLPAAQGTWLWPARRSLGAPAPLPATAVRPDRGGQRSGSVARRVADSEKKRRYGNSMAMIEVSRLTHFAGGGWSGDIDGLTAVLAVTGRDDVSGELPALLCRNHDHREKALQVQRAAPDGVARQVGVGKLPRAAEVNVPFPDDAQSRVL